MSDTPETDAVAVQFYAASTVTNSYLKMVDHARKLERQRDALLEALKDLHDAFQFTDESPGQGEAILSARKAIEEAEK